MHDYLALQSIIQVLVSDPVEKYMTAFADAGPLPASMTLSRALMRFFKDSAVPVVDDWGSCVGIAYRTDCSKVIPHHFLLSHHFYAIGSGSLVQNLLRGHNLYLFFS